MLLGPGMTKLLLLVTLAIGTSACTAHAPVHSAQANEALVRYARGESLEQLRTELSLADRDEARDLVHHAMLDLGRRYYKDR